MTQHESLPKGLVKRCISLLPNGESCRWIAFDEVTVLVNDSEKAESVPIRAYSCRNCGNIQPDGIPKSIYDQIITANGS